MGDKFQEGDILRLKSDCFGTGFIYEGAGDSDIMYARGHVFDESISQFRSIYMPEEALENITDSAMLPAVSKKYCEGDVVRLRLQPEAKVYFTISEKKEWMTFDSIYKIKVCWRDGAIYKESEWLPETMFIVVDIKQEQLNIACKEMLKKYEKKTPNSTDYDHYKHFHPDYRPSTVPREYPVNPQIWCGPATVESKGGWSNIDYLGGNYNMTM